MNCNRIHSPEFNQTRSSLSSRTLISNWLPVISSFRSLFRLHIHAQRTTFSTEKWIIFNNLKSGHTRSHLNLLAVQGDCAGWDLLSLKHRSNPPCKGVSRELTSCCPHAKPFAGVLALLRVHRASTVHYTSGAQPLVFLPVFLITFFSILINNCSSKVWLYFN